MVIFGAYALFVLLAIGVVLVLWIFMPFSVFGLKGQIKMLASEQRRTNELLETLIRQTTGGKAPTPQGPPPESHLPIIEPDETVEVKAQGAPADEFDIGPEPGRW